MQNIVELPELWLIELFKCLGINDLISLSNANVHLAALIDRYAFSSRSRDLLLCGHRNNPCTNERTPTPLTYLERILVSRNWVRGIYAERQFFRGVRMINCSMSLNSESLYISQGMYVRKFLRTGPESLLRYHSEEINTANEADIANFVRKENTIFAGHVNGTCFVTHDRGVYEQPLHHPKENLFCVDFVNNVYATSTNSSCKIWKRSNELELTNFDLLVNLKLAFKTIKLSDDGKWLFGGLYHDVQRQALRSINLESGDEIKLNSVSPTIFDLKIKDENILFTVNIDATFRMFDRRTNNDVFKWKDPLDSSLHCLEYDGLYGVLCGTNRAGRVVLYDIRMSGRYVQMYKSGSLSYINTPVCSIACDSQHMFVATDYNLRMNDFKTNSEESRDYSHLNEQHRLRNSV